MEHLVQVQQAKMWEAPEASFDHLHQLCPYYDISLCASVNLGGGEAGWGGAFLFQKEKLTEEI